MCLLTSKWWTSVDNGELIIKQAEKSAFSVGQSRQKCSQNQKKKKIRRKRSFLLNVIREEVRALKADMDNTGMYVRYIPITRDEVIEFCKNPETLSGSEGFAEKIEKQIEYKDLISRKYTKKRMTAEGVKKTYMNIYAHKLYMFVPQPGELRGQCYKTLIKSFIKDWTDSYVAERIVYCFRVTHKKTYSQAEMIIFSRLPLEEEVKKYQTYPNDYYWDPVKKRRASRNCEGAVLLHKKGDYILDKDGNRKEIVLHVEEHDTGLFFFREFESFVNSMKKSLRSAIDHLGLSRHVSTVFPYITARKGFSQASIGKVRIRNKLIRRVNESMYYLKEACEYFEDDFPEIKKKYYSFVHSMNNHLYEMTGSIEGLAYNLTYYQRQESFKLQMSMLERGIEEKLAKLHNWMIDNLCDLFTVEEKKILKNTRIFL